MGHDISLSQAMDALHRGCEILAGTALVLITAIIPYGVFSRYVLNSAASWPEPMAVLLMIVLSFFRRWSAIASIHIGVGVLPAYLNVAARPALHRRVPDDRDRQCSCWSGALGWWRRPGTRPLQTFRPSGRPDLPADSAGRRADGCWLIERFMTKNCSPSLRPEPSVG